MTSVGRTDSSVSHRTGATVVSVVVPTWHRAPWLDRCLGALERQARAPDEVVVVGREEDGPAREVVQRHCALAPFPVRWVAVSTPGHVAPVRRGREAARGDLVAFIDDDTEPEPGWLEALLEPFSRDDVACVGGRVVTPGFSGIVHADAGHLRWYGKFVGNVGALDAPGPIEVLGVMEGNWAWQASVLRCLRFDIALESDDASMYGLDLCLQARERGLRVIYTPRARVVHHAAPRDPALDRADRVPRMVGYSRNYTYIALKHLPAWRRAAFAAWWVLVGERGSYGLATAFFDLLLRRRPVLPLIAASLRGKCQGVRLWWKAIPSGSGDNG